MVMYYCLKNIIGVHKRERERESELTCRTNVSHIAHAMNENVCNIAKICKNNIANSVIREIKILN